MNWVIAWWLWSEVLGLLALPLTFLLFRNLPDRGYAFSKAFGLLLVSYLLWLGAPLLTNSRGALFLLLWVVGLGALVAMRNHRHQLGAFLRANLGLIVVAEGVFLLAFLLMAVVRAYNPEIQHTEQPMDFAFLNSAFQSPSFPPDDPWLSGHSISYYYFGYLMMAAMAKLTLTDTAVAYNLALSLIFALTALGAFGLVYNMIRLSSPGAINKGAAMGFGLVAVVLVLGIGNLEGVLELLYAHGWGAEDFWRWVGIKGLTEPYQSPTWYPTQSWWWWRATRVIDTMVGGRSIDYTITEFPFFSFLLGDLHPHLMALPFALMGLGLALQALASGQGWLHSHPLILFGVALSLGALGFINSWDMITLLLLFLAAIALSSWREKEPFFWRKYISLAVLVALIAFVLYIPFYWSFRSQVGGILPVRDVGTRPFHYLLIWGFFLFLGLSLAVSLVRRSLGKAGLFQLGLVASGVVTTPWLMWSGIEAAIGLMGGDLGVSLSAVAGKLGSLWPLMIVLTLLLVLLVRLSANGTKGLTFALLLLWGGVFLTYLCELFFVLDFFGNRMNTVFKIYYQVWLLLALSGAFALYYVSRHLGAFSPWGLLWRGGVATLLTASLFYPVAALYSKTDAFRHRPTLDGLAYLASNNPEEAQTIQWLKDNVPGGSVIVEATGGDYTEYARISGRTGLPTILGWPGHELQWRGSSRPFQGRAEDVAEMYRTTDGDRLGSLLDKYGVSYIYLGPLEREAYGIPSLGVVPPFLGVAFQNKEATIYQVIRVRK